MIVCSHLTDAIAMNATESMHHQNVSDDEPVNIIGTENIQHNDVSGEPITTSETLTVQCQNINSPAEPVTIISGTEPIITEATKSQDEPIQCQNNMSEIEMVECQNCHKEPSATTVTSIPLPPKKRERIGNATSGDFPLFANPSIFLLVLTGCSMDPEDLAKLEATCYFFRQPANLTPDHELSLPELAALDMCHQRAIFKQMTGEEREEFKRQLGGSWKLVLRFLLAGEACCRREKSQAIAGPGHSIFVNSEGAVYSFGSNNRGQLGHGTVEEEVCSPRQIRSLLGIRIIQATVGEKRTMLVSDAGQVYAFGNDRLAESDYRNGEDAAVSTPQLVESLKHMYVVQATIGHYFTAVLSREGRVYTFSWGNEIKLGHNSQIDDVEPRPLLGELENIPVAHISAGTCYLLALACQPSGKCVYSVGCGLGGKLGREIIDEGLPRLIEELKTLNLEPAVVAAGAWHAAVVGKDGRVCTWGWGDHGCLGHGNNGSETVPKVIEALSTVKAVHVATGVYTTFVVSEEGNVYSFGQNISSSLGHDTEAEYPRRSRDVLIPEVVTPLSQVNERVVQISSSNASYCNSHTFALTESGKLYSFGAGGKGQLGLKLVAKESKRAIPERVDVDLS